MCAQQGFMPDHASVRQTVDWLKVVKL
jgi:hypothetical protein